MTIQDGDLYTFRIGKGSRTTFKVETVISPAKRAQGLSGRPSLPDGTGMFFVFDSLSRQTMWMPDMKFALDIVWLDENLSIVHITSNATPCKSRDDCPPYSSVKRVKYAIEMTAGQGEAYGFVVGKQLTVI